MKVSFESPLWLLNESLKFNDYQYLLPYFYFRYTGYSGFFKNYRKQEGSFIICDNGLFEGETYSTHDQLKLISDVQPDIYIVPDVWNDMVGTYMNAEDWSDLKKSEIFGNTELMVVLQGNTLGQIATLYRGCVEMGYKHFAFNHSSEAYKHEMRMFGEPEMKEEDMLYKGRVKIINTLINDGTIETDHYIHLLGATNINEFREYDYTRLSSLDTSNPILTALESGKYTEQTRRNKPTGKMVNYFEDEITSQIKENVLFNVESFKNLIKTKI